MKMRSGFCIFLITASCTQNLQTPKPLPDSTFAVIYQEDSRLDFNTETQDARVQATAILIQNKKILPDREEQVTLVTDPLNRYTPLCPDERFLKQPTVGFCTGVLIGPNKVLTAGHCLADKDSCKDTKFIFGWTAKKAKNETLAKSEVYACNRILQHSLSRAKGLDYALVELDRSVQNGKPVAIAAETNSLVGKEMLSLSYPLGLPLKKDVARVLDDNGLNTFRVAVDTFEGSSGSPLFNDKNELVGILISGADDISEDEIYRAQSENVCVNFRRCENGQCLGENFLKIWQIDL